MAYLTYIPHSTQRQNKLEEEYFKYLESRERELIHDAAELKDFKKELADKYKELCEKHSRCKPKKHTWYEAYTGADLFYRCGYVDFYLLNVKQL